MKNSIKIATMCALLAAVRLSYAAESFENEDLTGMDFSLRDLTGANFSGAILEGTNFTGANLTGASLGGAKRLSGAIFTDAVIKNARFTSMTSSDITALQFYSTASYKDKDLGAISFSAYPLSSEFLSLLGWDFSGQRMSGSYFMMANIDGANFSGADLSGGTFANIYASGADFSYANLQNVGMGFFPYEGAENIGIKNSNFTGADFRGVIYQEDTPGECFVTYSSNNNTFRNFIGADGRIVNFAMASASDKLAVRKYVDRDGNANTISATLASGASYAMTGGTLTLEDEASFHIGGVLSLEDGGSLEINMSKVGIAAPILVDAGGSFNVRGGKISVNITGDFEEGDNTFTIVSGIDAGIVEAFEESLVVNYNGRQLANEDWNLNFDSGNLDLKILAIPEPAVIAAAFGAFALALAAYRRVRRTA